MHLKARYQPDTIVMNHENDFHHAATILLQQAALWAFREILFCVGLFYCVWNSWLGVRFLQMLTWKWREKSWPVIAWIFSLPAIKYFSGKHQLLHDEKNRLAKVVKLWSNHVTTIYFAKTWILQNRSTFEHADYGCNFTPKLTSN